YGATQDGDGAGVFARRYAAGGVPLGGEFQVNTSIAGDQLSPAVAVHPDGSFVVVWNDYSLAAIRGQRFDALGVPIGSEFAASGSMSQFPNVPTVATAETGFVVVWQGYVSSVGADEVVGQRFDGAGAPLGGEFQVNTVSGSFQGSPSVAADGNGNFVVV